MTLDGYLQRIGFLGPARVDLSTLRRIHRLHLAAIPYENLDVQLGRSVGFDIDAIYRKLVGARRGGWCYEMNGLMAWALERIGFEVTPLAGAVVRDTAGDESIGSHLALCVHLDRPYLADVGFGDGLIEPVPLEEGTIRQDEFEYRLERIDTRWWRFHNQRHGGAASFDFELQPAAAVRLTARCVWLQSAPESPFVLNAVCQCYRDGQLYSLRGCTLKVVRGSASEMRTIETAREYESVLLEIFGIDPPELPRLWRKVRSRHETWLHERMST